jgi:hypothetical protein
LSNAWIALKSLFEQFDEAPLLDHAEDAFAAHFPVIKAADHH